MSESGKAVEAARRRERLSAALRENLKRRKAQARGRETGAAVEPAAPGPEGEPHDSAGIGADKTRG
jgi:hypothetical protein